MRNSRMKRQLTALFLVGTMVVLALVAARPVGAADGPTWIGALYIRGKVGLKWQEFTGATQYTVYRQTAKGDWEQLTTVEEARYFDAAVSPGTVYSYKIAVAGPSGELFSEEKTVTIPGARGGDFSAPSWVGVRLDRQKIHLRWDKVAGAIAYNLYRSATPGGEYEVVGNVTSTRYVDGNDLEKGATYYYVLTALNEEFDESERSEERSVKFGQSAAEIAAADEAEKIVLEELPLTYLFDITRAGNNLDMNQPADVFVNAAGHIYVTDALNCQVNAYDASGKFLFSFGERSTAPEGEQAEDGSFKYPFTLFIDKNNQVYVADVQRNDIQVFSDQGDFIRRIGVEVDEGMAAFRPNGIHVIDDGRIIATDAGNHRLVFLDRDGKVLKSVGKNGGADGEFNFPDELVVTADNTICVVDVINSRVQEFDMDGKFIRKFGEAGQSAGTFGRPKGIMADAEGQLWVSDAMANMIQVFTLEGEVKSAFGGINADDLRLISPRGMFIHGDRLYVVNRLPHRVMVFQIS